MFEPVVIIAAASLLGLAIVVGALLHGWKSWIAFKLREIEAARAHGTGRADGSPMGASRIEIADLKERIRRLEAIANGVDL